MTLNQDVVDAVKAQIESCGYRSLRKAAAAMGRSHNWLGLMLRGQSPMTFEDLEFIAGKLQFDPYEVLSAARAGRRPVV